MNIGVISLGCAKNRVDTEQMLYFLTRAGHTLVSEPSLADALIVNTCGFINPAKEESIQTLLEMAAYKKTGRCRALVATGCLAQRYGDALLADMPEIDALLGVSQYDRVAEALEGALRGDRPDLRARAPGFLECGRVLTTPPYTAYVRIGEGCDNRCAYCAIPLIRGGYRSRPMAAVLDEMRGLAREGAREQILISQDTTRYGLDTGGSLRQLLSRAAAIEGIAWLRVLYMYPDEVDDALLDEMAAHPVICKYLDLPLQHASPSVLARMNRRGDMAGIRRLLLRARAMGFTLRTTFIVGFPGETEGDFARLMDFARDMRFDRMGAFAFSTQEDTPAALMPGQVPEEVKRERLDRLMRAQADISRQRNEARVGARARVLVTGEREGWMTGRSQQEAPDADGEILFSADAKPRAGDFVDVCITRADVYDVYGVRVDEPAVGGTL